MKLLSVHNLSKTYPNGTRALKGVSFDVEAEEFVTLVGLSGSGKSTLLRCLNRLLEPTSGSVEFSGQTIEAQSLTDLRKQIAMVFQQFNLIPRMTVLGNVLLGCLGRTPT